MKKIYLILFGLTIAALGSSCTQDSKGGGDSDRELTLSATVKYMDEVSTRMIGNDFFIEGSQIKVNITPNSNLIQPSSYIYTYDADGVFRGNPGYYFALDDNYIGELEALWPTEEVRNGTFSTDQRTLENHRMADWLTATASESGIMPTDTPVPLVFEHQNCMLEFEIVGQNTEGLSIQSLVLELQYKNRATAFWAYCGPDDSNAYLILEPGTELASTDNYMIGRLKASNNYDYTIILPKTEIDLEAGKRYLVTLVPQGYDMFAYVYIGGWIENIEHGIGIPFAPPTPDQNGNFIIETPQNLVTMSYLIRHYYPGNTFDWTSQTYVISDNMKMTAELAELYIPLGDSAGFTGRIVDESDNDITFIEYGDNEILQLYE